MSQPGLCAGISVITFDAAGTLVAPHPSVGAIYREVALRHDRDYPEDRLGAGFRHAFHAVSKDPTVLDPEARERDFWSRVVTQAIATIGPVPDNYPVFFDELYETFSHASRWRVFPGVFETLAILAERGLRLAVLSNWDHRLHTVLEETELRPFFDAVIISSEAGFEKPDPGIFRAAERALGVTCAACLHVGDSRKHDLEGAREAGWHGLIVRHGHGHGMVDDHEIDTLPELPSRLA